MPLNRLSIKAALQVARQDVQVRPVADGGPGPAVRRQMRIVVALVALGVGHMTATTMAAMAEGNVRWEDAVRSAWKDFKAASPKRRRRRAVRKTHATERSKR